MGLSGMKRRRLKLDQHHGKNYQVFNSILLTRRGLSETSCKGQERWSERVLDDVLGDVEESSI